MGTRRCCPLAELSPHVSIAPSTRRCSVEPGWGMTGSPTRFLTVSPQADRHHRLGDYYYRHAWILGSSHVRGLVPVVPWRCRCPLGRRWSEQEGWGYTYSCNRRSDVLAFRS